LLSPAPDPGASWIFVGLAQGDHVAKTPRGKKKDKMGGRRWCDTCVRGKSQHVQALANFSEKANRGTAEDR
jgi:hypothetical protein